MTLKIRVVTLNGWFDMDQPQDFDLPSYVKDVRAAGYVLNTQMYVPHDKLVNIFTFDSDNVPSMTSDTVPMGPSGTLQ